jgi:hypothetical protein
MIVFGKISRILRIFGWIEVAMDAFRSTFECERSIARGIIQALSSNPACNQPGVSRRAS